jgi:uncharacterized protein (TIGR03000 family)
MDYLEMWRSNMNKRQFVVVTTVALAVILLAAETGFAQMFGGRARARGYGGYGYYGNGYRPYGYGNYGYGYRPYSYGFSSYGYAPAYGYSGAYTPYASAYAPVTYGGTMDTMTNTPVLPANYERLSFYPTSTQNAPALLNIRVPAEAEVWIEGDKTAQTGTDRVFRSPTLEAGRTYTYEVKVRWMKKGEPAEDTRTVRVRAGEQSRVDFLETQR